MHIRTYEGTVKAVDGVNLQIGYGEIVGLVGESGSGKSMTSRTIVGLLPDGGKIEGGEIIFQGRDLLKIPEREMLKIRGADVSFIFQNPSSFLNPVLRVGDQIAETVMLHQKVRRSEAAVRAVDSLRAVGLREPEILARSFPHQLSGGMLQRVTIAMALSCKPALLIADECTTELDVTTQLQILEVLKAATRTTGCSLLLITHNLGVVAYMCDRAYVMYGGRVVESADVLDMFEHSRHPYTTGLLQSTLSAEATAQEFVSIKGAVADLMNPPSGCRFHPRCLSTNDRCRREQPPMVRVGDRHYTACFLYE